MSSVLLASFQLPKIDMMLQRWYCTGVYDMYYTSFYKIKKKATFSNSAALHVVRACNFCTNKISYYVPRSINILRIS